MIGNFCGETAMESRLDLLSGEVSIAGLLDTTLAAGTGAFVGLIAGLDILLRAGASGGASLCGMTTCGTGDSIADRRVGEIDGDDIKGIMFSLLIDMGAAEICGEPSGVALNPIVSELFRVSISMGGDGLRGSTSIPKARGLGMSGLALKVLRLSARAATSLREKNRSICAGTKVLCVPKIVPFSTRSLTHSLDTHLIYDVGAPAERFLRKILIDFGPTRLPSSTWVKRSHSLDSR